MEYSAQGLVEQAKYFLCGNSLAADDYFLEQVKLKARIGLFITDTRVRNALLRGSLCRTVEDVLNMSPRQCERIRGLGRKGRAQLVLELSLHGFDARHLLQEGD